MITYLLITFFTGILSAPEVELKQPIGSTHINLLWKQQCDLNPNYRIACKLYGLNYSLILTVNEEMTPDLENVSGDN